MRSGFNPNKDQLQQEAVYSHQLLIPVYIPNHEGYFKDSLEILKCCLKSLEKTVHRRTFITVVNNGSSETVRDYLDKQLVDGGIHELIHSTNIGKINAILKGLAGHDFELVTIADADVLFCSGWQEATYEIFRAFPKAGAVAPLSFPTFFKYYTAPVWADHWSSSALKFQEVRDPESLKAFAHSIGNAEFYKPAHLEKQLVLTHNGVAAGVGSGHFVNTYRGSLFDPPVGKHSPYQLGGDSETRFVDQPAMDAGAYRLSTLKGYAFHMGNTLEPWMHEELEGLEKSSLETVDIPWNKLRAKPLRNWWVKLIFKLLTRGPIWNRLLRSKGLSANQLRNY
ncbi:glycosyltransferase family 2 protein [Gilvibacter sp.]|uniref:glycosyltransferase family 2 protein n=1 Tax=Gilvibacter sp. TaxID=2729997 RepID=UPI003F4A6839